MPPFPTSRARMNGPSRLRGSSRTASTSGGRRRAERALEMDEEELGRRSGGGVSFGGGRITVGVWGVTARGPWGEKPPPRPTTRPPRGASHAPAGAWEIPFFPNKDNSASPPPSTRKNPFSARSSPSDSRANPPEERAKSPPTSRASAT